MYDIRTIAKEVGLLQEEKPIEKRASFASKDPLCNEIIAYLEENKLSSYLEKEAGAPASIVEFVRKAEEMGTPEEEIAAFLLEKQGYPVNSVELVPRYKQLLEKSAARIMELEKKYEIIDGQLEMVKVAMDLVEEGKHPPYMSFDELTQNVAKLIKEGNPELYKKALAIAKETLPSTGTVSNRPSTGGTNAKERFESALANI